MTAWLTHSIEGSSFYDKLRRLVFDRIRREGADVSALRQAKRELYKKNGVELEGYGEVDAELVAEYVEKNLLTDEAAIRAVVDYDRTLGQRILDFLNNLLGKLGSKSARERLFLSRAKRYYQAALEETQESSARAGQTVAEQEGNISRIGERLRSGELTDEQAEAIFNETYDPELDLRRNGAAEERRNHMPDRGDENTVFADGDGRSYSIEEIGGEKQDYGTGVILDTNLFNGVKPRNWGSVLSDYVYKHMAGKELTMYDEVGNPETVYLARANDRVQKDGANRAHKVIDKLARYKGDNIRALATVHLDEALEASKNQKSTGEHSHQWMDENGWIHRTAYLQDKSGNIYEATLNIADGRDRKILYDINNIRKIDKKRETAGGSVPSAVSGGASSASHSFSNTRNIADNSDSVNSKFSITEETPSESKTTQREDEYQAALNGFPQINGVQIVPYKTWVHATDIMSDEHGNILRDANGEARRRDNYGIVTGLDSGMPGRLLVSFRNDEYGTRASNVSIAPEDLEPVSKYKYASEKAFEDTMEQEPLEPANEQLSAKEQAEIENMRQAAEQREDEE